MRRILIYARRMRRKLSEAAFRHGSNTPEIVYKLLRMRDELRSNY